MLNQFKDTQYQAFQDAKAANPNMTHQEQLARLDEIKKTAREYERTQNPANHRLHQNPPAPTVAAVRRRLFP